MKPFIRSTNLSTIIHDFLRAYSTHDEVRDVLKKFTSMHFHGLFSVSLSLILSSHDVLSPVGRGSAITDIQSKIARHNGGWNFYGGAFFGLNVLSGAATHCPPYVPMNFLSPKRQTASCVPAYVRFSSFLFRFSISSSSLLAAKQDSTLSVPSDVTASVRSSSSRNLSCLRSLELLSHPPSYSQLFYYTRHGFYSLEKTVKSNPYLIPPQLSPRSFLSPFFYFFHSSLQLFHH